MKKMVAVIGSSSATMDEKMIAEEAGALIAKNGWILVNGGLTGVMEAASKGAAEAGGTVVGILPTADPRSANPYVTIPIATNLGHARNVVIAHSADVLIAIGGNYGTLSEIAVARKLGKTVFGIKCWEIGGVTKVSDAKSAVAGCKDVIG